MISAHGRHVATARLLKEAFPGSGVGDPAYLEWLYDTSPFGTAVETNRDDADGRVAHYAVVPLELALADGRVVPGALSLNTAVHARARRRGLFTELAEATYARARAGGAAAVVGVANDQSTPGFVRRLGFSLLGPLPALVIPPLPVGRRSPRTLAVTPTLLASSELDVIAPLLAPPAGGLARRWSVASLRWRLAAPGRRYALHVDDRAFAISTVATRRGIRLAVICAVFAPSALSRRDLLRLVGDACRHQRAVAAVRVGVNRNLPALGASLPKRLRESPLNLIHRDLEGARLEPPAVARWEAIDFDAF